MCLSFKCFLGTGGGMSSSLTDTQSCCIVAVKILCSLCRHPDFSFELDTGDLGESLVADYVLGELMRLLDSDKGNWNCTRPFDLQLVRCS